MATLTADHAKAQIRELLQTAADNSHFGNSARTLARRMFPAYLETTGGKGFGSQQYQFPVISCGFCSDTGRVEASDYTVKILEGGYPQVVSLVSELGAALVFEACPNPTCAKGVAELVRWRATHPDCPAHCEFGKLKRDPERTFCPVCEEGCQLKARMEEQIAAIRQKLVAERFIKSGIADELAHKTFANFQCEAKVLEVSAIPANLTLANLGDLLARATTPTKSSANGNGNGKSGSGAGRESVKATRLAVELITCEEASELAHAKSQAIEAAKAGWSVFMPGDTGQGKSHLAAAMLNYAVNELGKVGMFVNFLALLESLEATLNRQGENELNWSQLLREYLAVDVLVVDEVGLEKLTDKRKEVLYV